MKKQSRQQTVEESLFMIEPLAERALENAQGEADCPVLKLQLTMATNSINHEYARMEFEEAPGQDRQEELLDYMNSCRQKYLEARESLATYDPAAVTQFESDLFQQKLRTLNRFNA